MISYNYETEFQINQEADLSKWIIAVINSHDCVLNEINYIFMDDQQLHKLNVDFLNHDNLTDIISFDYSVGNNLQCEIHISVELVADNAKDFKVSFQEELHRVLIHGVLHYCGFKDKTDAEAKQMRNKEDEALALLKL
jgi:rRNA maturation RNase YbeY